MVARKRARPIDVVVKEVTPAVVAATKKDWFERAKDIVMISAVLSALGLGTIISFSRGIIESGPLPLSSRAEVAAIAKAVQEIHEAEETVHAQLTNQLSAQAKVTDGILEQQRQELADTRTARLRFLQSNLEAARANVTKEPTVSNEQIVETLRAQLDALQIEIMKAAKDMQGK